MPQTWTETLRWCGDHAPATDTTVATELPEGWRPPLVDAIYARALDRAAGGFWKRLTDAAASGPLEKSVFAGGFGVVGTPFRWTRETPDPPALLVGLDVAFRPHDGRKTLSGIRPHFVTRKGRRWGVAIGNLALAWASRTRVDAPPGYAVAGLVVSRGLGGILGLQLIFAKLIEADDGPETITSPWLGAGEDGKLVRIEPRRGRFAVGLQGRISSVSWRLNQIGLVFVDLRGGE